METLEEVALLAGSGDDAESVLQLAMARNNQATFALRAGLKDQALAFATESVRLYNEVAKTENAALDRARALATRAVILTDVGEVDEACRDSAPSGRKLPISGRARPRVSRRSSAWSRTSFGAAAGGGIRERGA